MKAKDKLLKRDGDERPDTGSYESFYYGGVDPYMWEPQELGETNLRALYSPFVAPFGRRVLLRISDDPFEQHATR